MRDCFHHIGRVSKFRRQRVEVRGAIEDARHAGSGFHAGDGLLDLAERYVPGLAAGFVDRGEHGGQLRFFYSNLRKNRGEKLPVRHSSANIARGESDCAHHVDRNREELRIRRDRRFAEDVDVELKVLAQPSLLLPLVAEQLGNGEPPNGLPHGVRFRGDHAREGGRHLGTKRHFAAALVGEGVQLADDLIAALFCVELERLQGRTIVFDEPVSPRDVAPDRHEIVTGGELLGVKVSKSW